MKKPLPPNLKRLAAAKQRRLDELLDKNAEGTIAPGEKAELERLVAEAERLMVANAKRLAAFAADENAHAPSAAVPVTIWVKPEHAQS
jgi:hypothetical protein